jgi:hypothetical protein
MPQEPISGPPAESLEPAPPAWLNEKVPIPSDAAPSAEEESQAGILVSAIDLVHDRIAEATRYDGWRLSEKELKLWQNIIRHYIKYLPMKDWPHLMDIIGLVVMYASKGMGYLAFRKRAIDPAQAPS